jgi:outer membrane protein TolC
MSFLGDEGMSVLTTLSSAARRAFSLTLAAVLATASFAQDAPPQNKAVAQPEALEPMPQAPKPQHNAHLYSSDDYTRAPSAFPRFWQPYVPRDVPAPNLTNSARIDSVLRDGKMYLSLNDAVALALENNLDIAIQRYNLSTADTDILRTASGAPALGVNAGLLQGTPGGTTGTVAAGGTGTSSTGTTGGGAGGGTVAVGGAGAGAAGIVSSTTGIGPPIPNYDPIVTGTGLLGERATTPQSNVIFTGTQTLVQNTSSANFLYSQGFASGTQMSVGFNNGRNTSNALFNTLSPALTSSFRFTVSQHLLQGFGFDPNLRWIRIARNNREIMDVAFRLQIMTTVSQIENIYWNLVNAYENVKVQERALELANKTLSDTEKQVQIGTLAPITVVQSKSSVATANQNLTIAQTNLQLQQLLMKNAVTRNVADPILAIAPVIPTDTLQINAPFEIQPVEDLINRALQARPEIIQSRINLTNKKIGVNAINSLLKPQLDIYAFYGASGLSGQQNPLCPIGQPNSAQCTATIPPGGYNNAFANLFNSSGPDKGVGLNLNVTLRNRQAQSDQVRSQLEYRQSEVAVQQQENTIVLQVRQAQFALQQNYAALQSAVAARDYAQQNLDAEQKKYSLGASTSTLVLQASSALTQAQSNVLAAATNYEQSRVQLDLVTADTLTKLGIDMSDAESGNVKQQPKVPGVVPNNPANLTLSQPATGQAGTAVTPQPGEQPQTVPPAQQTPPPQNPPQQ